MAITNHNRVGEALELLTGGLKPFVERGLKSSRGRAVFRSVELEMNWIHRDLSVAFPKGKSDEN